MEEKVKNGSENGCPENKRGREEVDERGRDVEGLEKVK